MVVSNNRNDQTESISTAYHIAYMYSKKKKGERIYIYTERKEEEEEEEEKENDSKRAMPSLWYKMDGTFPFS